MGLIANASNQNMDISSLQSSSSPNASFQSGSGTHTCMMPEMKVYDALETIKLQLNNATTIQEREMIRERLEQILNESESVDFSK